MNLEHANRRIPYRLSRLLALAAGCVLCIAPVYAQVGANVGGVVADTSGAAIPSATVTITNTANGVSQAIKAGAAGNYRAVNLPPAAYEISVEAQGFATAKKDVTLLVGSDVTLNFTLGLEGVTQTVTVTGEAASLVETTKSQPKSVMDATQLSELPVLNRDFLVIAENMPGAASTDNLSHVSPYSVVKFGGVADQASGYTTLIDGAAIDDATWGTPIINMSQDAIQEFTVYRNQFDAQYGHALNAVVSVVTKAGGDQLHGTFYYFGRDVNLNARPAFATVIPPYSLFRGGATVGGPIKREKTHYFAAVEYLDIHTAGIEALPLKNPFAAEENGNYPYIQTEKMGDFRIDHSFTDTNAFYARYDYDHFTIPSSSPSNTTGTSTDSRAHSLVAEDNWVISPSEVNTLRYTFLYHDLATLPTNYNTTVQYLDFTFGQNDTAPQYFPRTNHEISDTLFINKSTHDIKIGFETMKEFTSYYSHYYENGLFVFTSDNPFNAANPATWPISFTQQTAGNYYHHAWAFGPYVQDDWRVLPHLRLNLGLRYDFETNLLDNGFYHTLLNDPAFPGINHFISNNRGSNWAEGWQPRGGFAWDVNGKGDFVVHGGFGKYMTREREYWDNAAETQTWGAAVQITNPLQLQNYPNIPAVLNGQSLTNYVSNGGARSVVIIPNDFKLPYSLNTTVGFSWKVNAQSSLNVDYVHTHDLDDLGETDLNLPLTGALTASNPRPVPTLGRVASIEPFGQSWYDALEVQYRTRVKGFQVLTASYTYSRSLIDGVTWYSTFSGTDRFKDDYGYNPTNTPNNVSLTWTTVYLPGRIQLSGAFHAVSGPPVAASAGIDLDGDGNSTNDRPLGLPVTIGYGDVNGQLELINAFRANPCGFTYFSSVTCTAKPLGPISANLLQHHPAVSLDMRVTRPISITESKRLDLFFEGYNITNFVTLGTGNTSILSTTFLIPASSLPARQLQWGARFNF